MPEVTLANVDLFLGAVLKFVQAIAVVSVGIWAIYRFGIFRDSVPRVNVTHHISHRRLTSNTIHVSLTVVFSNTGRVVWSLDSSGGSAIVRLIKPIEHEDLARMHREFVIDETETEYAWPAIYEQKLKMNHQLDIEPSDMEELYYHFVIPEPAETIEIISYHSSDGSQGIEIKTVYDLVSPSDYPEERINDAE